MRTLFLSKLAALKQTLKQAEEKEKKTDGDTRPPRTETAIECNQRLNHAQDHDANQRPRDEAHAPRQQGAANHGSRDGVHLEPDGV